jgi:NADH-quinone oxidoreductase subunit J
MNLGEAAQIFTFSVFALISVAGALGMTTTMSMFRSGIFLMSSFIGVAGLFILLMADLLGMLQIMMYIGGMLVMILFMVLFSHDPGGDMMAKMKLPFIEKFFSLGLLPKKKNENGHSHHYNDDDNNEDEHGGMDMGMDMSMFTSLKPYAAWIGLSTTVILALLFLLFPDWPAKNMVPDQDSSHRIGHLLMGKYMMAFEGAGLMILLGIYGAIYLARPGKHPDSKDRNNASAINEDPPPAAEDPVEPYYRINIKDLYEKVEADK